MAVAMPSSMKAKVLRYMMSSLKKKNPVKVFYD
jgi:hypothetical protein